MNDQNWKEKKKRLPEKVMPSCQALQDSEKMKIIKIQLIVLEERRRWRIRDGDSDDHGSYHRNVIQICKV